MSDAPPNTEAELEAFRQRWREEVSTRNQQTPARPQAPRHHPRQQRHVPPPIAGPSPARRKDMDETEEIEPQAYHDLPDREEQWKLASDGDERHRPVNSEPRSALEHYERAVEKETQGQLGDSMRHYRRAFKVGGVATLHIYQTRPLKVSRQLDDGVHEAYKRKHFPPSSFLKPKPAHVNPSNASPTVPGTVHHSLHGSSAPLPPTLQQLVDEFSGMRIEAPPPPTDASPEQRSVLGELPEEILSHILVEVAINDVATFARLAQVCKRLAYLVLTEDAIWKRVAVGSAFGFKAMLYDFACEIDGDPLHAGDSIARYLDLTSDTLPLEDDLPLLPAQRETAFSALTEQLLHSTYASSYRQMFRSRPRIRFNGCYISTVNYTRPGGNSTNTLTWGAPVHVVTYFRYLRFFPDGTAISLLTTTEPADVVHHLTKANLHNHHTSTALPSSVMKDALRGRWRLTGPLSSHSKALAEAEVEGDLIVETEGVVPKYTYQMHLALSHAGKSTRNNKLAWKWYGCYNRLTDDWGEFGLRNDKAFYYSRVKSYAGTS
ncbi:F-box protein pof7 [Teratosphaeria destructans]|uniref:F-box protein pof7 n=1 Tax=Teratosphaeria destructans TaxID=418781 RepID=A0A9W7W1K7_9PEZI|nr:F-box protein pof7 [Teratosphaeria destructans]